MFMTLGYEYLINTNSVSSQHNVTMVVRLDKEKKARQMC